MSQEDDLRRWALEQAATVYRHGTPDEIVQAAEKFAQFARGGTTVADILTALGTAHDQGASETK